MGKKKQRASQTSKGIGRNVSKWVCKAIRKDVTLLETMRRKREAFNKGKNVVVTIPNPDKMETNKPFIRVNAKEVWRKSTPFMMKSSDG
jgi:hypothetical protein